MVRNMLMQKLKIIILALFSGLVFVSITAFVSASDVNQTTISGSISDISLSDGTLYVDTGNANDTKISNIPIGTLKEIRDKDSQWFPNKYKFSFTIANHARFISYKATKHSNLLVVLCGVIVIAIITSTAFVTFLSK